MNADRNATGTGAYSVTLVQPYAPPPVTRGSLLSAVSFASTKNAMAAPTFMPPTQSLRTTMNGHASFPQPIAPLSIGDRDATKPIGTPYSANSSTPSTALIRRLPLNTSEETLRLMMVFSKDLQSVEVLPMEQSEDAGFRSAILKFRTLAGAREAKSMLDGKSNISNDANMVVEILDLSPTNGRRYHMDSSLSPGASTATSSAASSATSSRQPSRFNGAFQSLNDKMAGSRNGMYANGDLSKSESSAHYQSIFSPQSPIGGHLTEHTRMSGKTLINNDSADDDETGELLKDPVAYAENGAMGISQRRSTVPTIPVSRLAGLSLSTPATNGSGMLAGYGISGMPVHTAHSATMSPTGLAGGSAPVSLAFNQHFRPHNYPPANPADQNPPCNTLYVGNLPIDTSEEELKALFSKQRGYKRLCFRTKQNGPMCFVEFEDVSAATKALNELYGWTLHNSVKGGIRLSFSKNPLGVRSSQNPTQMAAASMGGMPGNVPGPANGFTTANGPPPGLPGPPGLPMNRSSGFSGSTTPNAPYGAPGYSNPPSAIWSYPALAVNGATSLLSGTGTYPPHMMGK